MKLSELFKTPFKVKGGGVLNLRGFSKSVVDKEVGEGGGGGSESGVISSIIEQFYNSQMAPHPSKFYMSKGDNIVDISDIHLAIEYTFLYKKSDYENFSSQDDINTNFRIDINGINLYFGVKGRDADIIYETTIGGEAYVALGKREEPIM